MNENSLKIKDVLSGENAFYNQASYPTVTFEEMASSKPLSKLTYTYSTENKVWRIAKTIFSLIIFPIGIYKFIHSIIGTIIVPASCPELMGYKPDHPDQSRKGISLESDWKVKRISIEIDGNVIDAAIMGRPSTLGNGRWVLSSNGNAEFYEDKLKNIEFKHILAKLNSNVLVFNYPGVGASLAMPNRNAMAKAYCAMLKFLEDKKEGIGAKEIIGYGQSIGAGVQGDALLSHKLKEDVKYVFVKSRSFSDLSTTASYLTNRFLGFLVKVFGWNISSVESSKKLKAPEIIMQTANVEYYSDISNEPQKIIDDGVIPAEATLAKKLLNTKKSFAKEKYFMGIREGHNDPLVDPDRLVEKINEMLESD